MAQVFRYDGNDLGNTVVRLGSEQGLTQLAEMGSVGSTTLILDDPTGSLQIAGLRPFTVDENSATSGNRRVFTGYLAARTYRRGDTSLRTSLRTNGAREIECSLLDLNAVLTFKVITGTTGKRPAETAGARLTWLIASGYVAVFDNGLVTYPTTAMDANDYRGQRPADVLGDCAVATHSNFFVYYHEANDQASLWFGDTNTSTAFTSSLQISNILADIDSTVTGGVGATQTWSALGDASMVRDPNRKVDGVYLPYQNGAVYRTDTLTPAVGRDGVAPNSNVKSRTKATAIADRFLADNATEDDRITVNIEVASANVNDIKAGQLMKAEFSFLAPDYDTFSDFRVMRCSPAQDKLSADFYTIGLELSPATPPINAIVQSVVGTANSSSVTMTFPSDVKVGNYLVFLVSERGHTLPTGPNVSGGNPRWGAGAWTRANGSTRSACYAGSPANPTDGSAIYYKVADSTARACQIPVQQAILACVELDSSVVTTSGLVTAFADLHAASVPATIGTLGSVAANSVALAIFGFDNQNVVPTGTLPTSTGVPYGWTTLINAPGIYPFGVFGNGTPWAWIGYQNGSGGTIAGSITGPTGGNGTNSYGAVGVVLPAI